MKKIISALLLFYVLPASFAQDNNEVKSDYTSTRPHITKLAENDKFNKFTYDLLRHTQTVYEKDRNQQEKKIFYSDTHSIWKKLKKEKPTQDKKEHLLQTLVNRHSTQFPSEYLIRAQKLGLKVTLSGKTSATHSQSVISASHSSTNLLSYSQQSNLIQFVQKHKTSLVIGVSLLATGVIYYYTAHSSENIKQNQEHTFFMQESITCYPRDYFSLRDLGEIPSVCSRLPKNIWSQACHYLKSIGISKTLENFIFVDVNKTNGQDGFYAMHVVAQCDRVCVPAVQEEGMIGFLCKQVTDRVFGNFEKIFNRNFSHHIPLGIYHSV